VAPRAAGLVAGPLLGPVGPAAQRGVAAPGGAGEGGADPAAVDLAEPAAPLPGHPAGRGPRLGAGAAAADRRAAGRGRPLAGAGPRLGHDRLVVPLAPADEGPGRLARRPGLDGDRLGRLAPRAAEPAADDRGRRRGRLGAIGPGRLAPAAGRQAVGPIPEASGVTTASARRACASG